MPPKYPRSITATISFGQPLLDQIDRYRALYTFKMTRSQFVCLAVQEYLKTHPVPEINAG